MSTDSFEHLVDGCSCQGKACSKCRQNQCHHAFPRDKRRKDGLHGHCRTCRTATRGKHRQSHPDMTCVTRHNYRARKENAIATLTAQEWLNLKALYGYRCLCCGKQEPEITLTLDHIIPISKGGSTTFENIQPLCLTCNDKKSKKATDFRPHSNETSLQERTAQ
jgi:5-methylcytosine-specific restriction endonuclease McrA